MDTILQWLKSYTQRKDFVGMTITITIVVVFALIFAGSAADSRIKNYDQLNIQPTLAATKVQLIEHKTTLDDHETRIKGVEQMKADLAVLKQMACDAAEHAPPSCYSGTGR